MVEFFLFALMASLVILVFNISRLWAFRHAAGALELFLCGLACGVWSLGYLLEILLPGMADKLLWAKIEYLGIATVPVWLLLFILRYTGQVDRFHIRYAAALLVIPIVTILLIFTNGMRGWMWTSIAVQPNWPMAPLDVEHGAWFWVNIGYSYLLLVSGTVLLVRHISRIQRHYLTQPLIMLVAMLAPWVGNALYIIGLRPGPNLDLTPMAFTFTNIGLVMGFLRFRLLDILPVAYSSIFKFMSDGVVVIDIHQRLIDMNPAARQIFSRLNLSPPTQPVRQKLIEADPWMGQPLSRLMPGFELPDASSTAIYDNEWSPNQGKAGGGRVYSLRTTPIFGQRQQITGQILIFSDITKLKRAEEELKTAHQQAVESNRLKTQLLANVSHDMRTPLGAIIGFSEMLNGGVYGELGKKQKNAITDIHESANQLLLFVNNLIGQAQFETGKILIKPKRFDAVELLEACQSSINAPASRKGLRMNYEMDPALPAALVGDLYWLRQVTLNLVNNAVKFTDQGSVTLRLGMPDSQHWTIEVTDTGPGISAEAQAAIFEPFRQVEGTPARERGGSGLGLAIVKELASLMGGQVSLSSQPGAGSTFRVCFPLIVEEQLA